jgi:cell division protein FtsW
VSAVSAAGSRSRLTAALAPLDRPLTSYYLIIGSSVLLLAIGLVMVLSTSSAIQLDNGQAPYAGFEKQLVGAVAGLVLMWLLSKAPVRLFRAAAYPLLLASIASLVLVLAFGTSVNGAERWIVVAGLQVQPSEFAKFAFLVWGADLLARKEKLRQLNDWRTLLIPLLPGVAVIAMLVMLGDDLGTTFLLLIILLALLWVVGTPARMFVGILGLVLFALLLLVVVGHYGGGRISGFLHPNAGGPVGPNMQRIQGTWAISSGGLFGVGLGNGTGKWGWVPEANTDYIFAILGQELGLAGTFCVLMLYGALAWAGLRVARRVADPFMRFAAAGVVALIVGQALVNISEVVGLLPITGVPLPLISEGLSSLIATLAAVGMLLSFAKCEPGAREALAAVDRRFRLRLPAALHRPEPDPASGQRPRSRRGDGHIPPGPAPLRTRAPSRLADPGRQSGSRPAAAGSAGRAGPAKTAGPPGSPGPVRYISPRPGGAGSRPRRPRPPGSE